MQRGALEQPNDGEPQSGENTVSSNGILGVVRATRGEPTTACAERDHRQDRRQRALVDSNQPEQQGSRRIQHVTENGWQAAHDFSVGCGAVTGSIR
jgi:hypothetical protein